MTEQATTVSLVEREHPAFHSASYRPPYCPLCWPNGAPTPSVEVAEPTWTPVTPSIEAPTPAAVRRERDRQRGEGFEPLRAALERFRSRIVVNQPDEPDTGLAPDGGPLCDTCHGSRFVRRDLRVDDPAFGLAVPCPAAECAAFMAERYLERFWRSTGSDGYRRFSLESYPTYDPEQRRALAMVREWLKAPLSGDGWPWLYLWGDTGRGKTSLAISAARARGGSALFVTVPDLLVRIAGTYDRESGERDQPRELDLLEQLWTVSVLVLDDFGAEAPTAWAAQRVYQVVNRRASDPGLVTIVTSNLNTQGLSVHLNRANPEHGARTVSRIVGRAHPYIVKVGGPDLRMRGLVQSVRKEP